MAVGNQLHVEAGHFGGADIGGAKAHALQLQ
jgi:hypothetical protein